MAINTKNPPKMPEDAVSRRWGKKGARKGKRHPGDEISPLSRVVGPPGHWIRLFNFIS